jgi:hypothetical protein
MNGVHPLYLVRLLLTSISIQVVEVKVVVPVPSVVQAPAAAWLSKIVHGPSLSPTSAGARPVAWKATSRVRFHPPNRPQYT